MPPDVLKTRLAQMQQAYLDLATGVKSQAASYAPADGSRSVTYTQASIGSLVQVILDTKKQLAALEGRRCNPRRPVGPFF
ncbi:hypothetical protein G3A43_42530 [Paraburkholderia aspalathi]|nr:hypothetical protein [Paraburkholderia aspalathi]